MFPTEVSQGYEVGNLMPHSREAEEAVVGSVLINADVYSETGLQADNFYIHKLRFIWDAFTSLHNRSSGIDFLTVCQELENTNRLEEVGGLAYLTALLNQVPTSLNAADYADIVREKWTARHRLQVANTLAVKSYQGQNDISEELDALSKSVTVKRGAIKMREGLNELMSFVAEREKHPSDVWGIHTGLPDLDNMTGGLQSQQTTLIAGKPEAGKTTLMLQIAMDAAAKGHGVAIYELEMDLANVQMRMITLLGGPTVREMMRGRIPEDKKAAYINAIGTLDTLPLYISDNPTMTTLQIGADLARLQATRSIDMVCLDYLDLLKDSEGDTDNERSKMRSRRFRQVCRERKIAGLSVQSLTKAGIAADEPDVSDVSGPAGVLFDADNIFLLTKDKKDIRNGKLIPAKMRYGENVGTINLVRNGMRFGCVARLP